MSQIEFGVDGFPPSYDSGFSILNPKHPRHPQVMKLQEVARKAIEGKSLLRGRLALEVEHEIFHGEKRTDVVNLIGGIANVLEGIVYANDNQIKEVSYKQLRSNKDRYVVKVREI